MFFRPLLLGLALIGAGTAVAQPPVDVLTGEPARPRGTPARPQPEIFNAPHAPRQSSGGPADGPPMQVYVAPQVGTGSSGMFNDGSVPMRPPIRRP